MKKNIILSFLLSLVYTNVSSQIAGTFNVPGNFPTIAAAINTLNLTGVAGPVTINVLAGHTETVPVGGLKLINPPGSSTTTITFQKQGTGSNPLLTAYTGTSSSSFLDGIWMLVDCKNVTIDAIDLIDNNTSVPATMEFGYGFYKFTEGNLNNTIRNCVITMSGNGGTITRGILLTNNNYLSYSSIVPSSTLQTNSYNSFYNNVVQNCGIGISITGYNLNSFKDTGNDIGGVSAATGNTILNFKISGVSAVYQSQFNASHNNINNSFFSVIGIEGINASGIGATLNSNTITLQSSGNSSKIVGLCHNGTNGSVTINNNVFPLLTYTTTSTGASHSVIASNGNDATYINNNQISSFTANNGTVNLIAVTGGNTAVINNNSIMNATVTSQGVIKGITCSSSIQQINNNYLTNLIAFNNSTSSFSGVYSIYSPAGGIITTSSNTITSIRGNSLFGIALWCPTPSSTYSVANNIISDFAIAPSNTLGSTTNGISALLSNTTAGTSTIRNNIIHDIVGQGPVYGIASSGGVNDYLYQNKIYNLSSNTTVFGINANGGVNHIYNNLIGGLNTTGSSNICALNLTNASKVYFNTLYMNASGSTNSTGTNLVSSITSSTLELRNNILVNATSGPGVPAIISANNILSTSNNNSFYFGTNGRIFRTAPSTSVLPAYQAIFGSDSKSFIENPNFVSLTGSNPNFLNINTSIPTQIESGAVSISTITTDFIGAARSATPDVGAWEGNYIMADALSPTVTALGFTGAPCNTSSRTFTANITDSSAIATGTLSPRLYYRVNFTLYSSVQGSLTSGTTKNGIWTFPLTYTANLGDVIWYFLVAQDTSYLKNVRVIPSGGASVTDVNTINVPPNPAFNYTLQTFPNISVAVTNTNICSGQSYIIVPSGASSYSYFPGNTATVSPNASTTYSVTGESSLGCASTNTVTVNITVDPTPTLTVNSGTICSGQSFTIVPNGATSYSYSGGSAVVAPTSTIIYTVSGTSTNSCVGLASSTVVVSICTGLMDLNNYELSIWPNPTNSGVYLSNKNYKENFTIKIIDAMGRVVSEKNVLTPLSYIDLSNNSDGLYFIEIINDNRVTLRSKIIISR